MVFSTEFLNLVKILRHHFKQEGLGSIRLQDEHLLARIVDYAQRSERAETKDLAFEILRLADVQLSRSFLDHSGTETPKVPRTYRGQAVQSSPDEQPSLEQVIKPRAPRWYRGVKTG